jgi:hypothetical protein
MATFKADKRAIGTILVSDEIRAVLVAKAETAKGIAEVIAPFDPNDRDGDHYRDHFQVTTGSQIRKTRRAYAELSNDHPAAAAIEYGTGSPDGSRTPAHHTRLRSVEAMKEQPMQVRRTDGNVVDLPGREARQLIREGNAQAVASPPPDEVAETAAQVDADAPAKPSRKS